MVVKICGKLMWLCRAVDDDGEVLDCLVQKRRNTDAAVRLRRKLLKHHGVRPKTIVTDKLASNRAEARARQQPSREFVFEYPTTETQTTAVQVAIFSPKVPRHSRRRLQHLQHPETSDQPTYASLLPSRGRSHMARRDRGCMTGNARPALTRLQ